MSESKRGSEPGLVELFCKALDGVQDWTGEKMDAMKERAEKAETEMDTLQAEVERLREALRQVAKTRCPMSPHFADECGACIARAALDKGET